jgi:hypothetical protein
MSENETRKKRKRKNELPGTHCGSVFDTPDTIRKISTRYN